MSIWFWIAWLWGMFLALQTWVVSRGKKRLRKERDELATAKALAAATLDASFAHKLFERAPTNKYVVAEIKVTRHSGADRDPKVEYGFYISGNGSISAKTTTEILHKGMLLIELAKTDEGESTP